MEKYGTVPKKFTKKWWEYFWDYYKIQTIAVALVVAAVAYTIYANVTATRYDLHVSYIGTGFLVQDLESAFDPVLESAADEITENDKKDINYFCYTLDVKVAPTAENMEMENAMKMKFVAELDSGACDFYLLSRNNAESLANVGNCFEEVSVYAPNSEDVIFGEDGVAFAVSLSGNRILEEAGIDTSDLYLAVRKLYERAQEDESRVKMHENSLTVARHLMGA